MSEPPPSNYPRPPIPGPPKELTRTERYAGCGCVFLPVGLLALAMTGALLLGESHLPDGSIGREPGRGFVTLMMLGFVAYCVGLGSAWLRGRPHQRGNAGCLLIAMVGFVIALFLFPAHRLIAVLLGVFALIVVVSTFLSDRPSSEPS